MADKPAETTPTAEKPAPVIIPNTVPAVELLLIGGFAVMVLNYLMGWGLFGSDRTTSRPAIVIQPQRPSQPTTQSPVSPPAATPQTSPATAPQVSTGDAAGTHRVLCSSGNQGLNFRPSAGFSTPLFAIPCGKLVTVTGNPVTVQNETWSPITYANRQGWSATKLLQPRR
ncbi:hypothetical protein IQ266_10855 [filamentous cyanobacterium LEGE 11480]|uniref:SH3 domain-containing protein n=1 Tax=Romeriopsis navalis LEGE 11480 TaxID=2777977 RepID=A0A928Z336_9CYAN|nr:hypothetical protein [Romeriopsis navalis]MBE9030229.1 hypothetical protein [Romeriopsis navalis LEGE 11480]